MSRHDNNNSSSSDVTPLASCPRGVVKVKKVGDRYEIAKLCYANTKQDILQVLISSLGYEKFTDDTKDEISRVLDELTYYSSVRIKDIVLEDESFWYCDSMLSFTMASNMVSYVVMLESVAESGDELIAKLKNELGVSFYDVDHEEALVRAVDEASHTGAPVELSVVYN